VTVTDTFKSFSFEGSSVRRDIEQAAKHGHPSMVHGFKGTYDQLDEYLKTFK
jgi:hypothetical protein